MPDLLLVTPGAAEIWWVLPAALLLAGTAMAAAVLDGVLAAPRNRARGAVAPLLEIARLLRQRRRQSVAADLLLWRMATFSLVPVAMLMVTLVPFGSRVLFDSPVGVVWFNALDVMVWALVWLAGWGPNAVYGLVGGYRFLAQALGYELPLMFALVAPAVAAGSLRVGDVAAAQSGLWYVVWMPVAFAVYCIGVVAFSVWGPFAVPAGADLAGGVLAELSGVDRLLFLAGRYALLAAGSAMAVPLFLGGGAGPLLPDWAWVLLKTGLLLAVLVAVRRRLPAVRPDKFVEAAWVVLLPVVLLQDLVVAVVAVGRS